MNTENLQKAKTRHGTDGQGGYETPSLLRCVVGDAWNFYLIVHPSEELRIRGSIIFIGCQIHIDLIVQNVVALGP